MSTPWHTNTGLLKSSLREGLMFTTYKVPRRPTDSICTWRPCASDIWIVTLRRIPCYVLPVFTQCSRSWNTWCLKRYLLKQEKNRPVDLDCLCHSVSNTNLRDLSASVTPSYIHNFVYNRLRLLTSFADTYGYHYPQCHTENFAHYDCFSDKNTLIKTDVLSGRPTNDVTFSDSRVLTTTATRWVVRQSVSSPFITWKPLFPKMSRIHRITLLYGGCNPIRTPGNATHSKDRFVRDLFLSTTVCGNTRRHLYRDSPWLLVLLVETSEGRARRFKDTNIFLVQLVLNKLNEDYKNKMIIMHLSLQIVLSIQWIYVLFFDRTRPHLIIGVGCKQLLYVNDNVFLSIIFLSNKQRFVCNKTMIFISLPMVLQLYNNDSLPMIL